MTMWSNNVLQHSKNSEWTVRITVMIPNAFAQILSWEEPGYPSSSSTVYLNANLEISGGTLYFYEGKFKNYSSTSLFDPVVSH